MAKDRNIDTINEQDGILKDNISDDANFTATPEETETVKSPIMDLLFAISRDKDKDKSKKLAIDYFNKKLIQYKKILHKYKVIFLYDEYKSISDRMADKIYESIFSSAKKPILLVLHSNGGRIEPAYLISKTCKNYSDKFVVVIPRKAKSAATLISFGANEIHMGSLSELGPIDPQINELPALAINSSLESLAKLVSKYPKSNDMFSKLLISKVDLTIFGYLERVSESAEQYAERLLEGKTYPLDINKIAHSFVYDYKDHSFVIDKDEALIYLGDTIKENTDEYTFANDIHQIITVINSIASYSFGKYINIVGTIDDLDFDDEPTQD